MFRSRYISAKLSDLSTYRTQLMGIATLMVIICHANAYHVQLPRLVVSIFTWGNLGVDIFLFLSGIGLYYSLSKRNINKKEDYLSFYKKRFFRIYIPYLMICLPYCLIFILLGIYSLGDCILCLSTLGYWLFHRGAWFVSIILILYLVGPFLFRILSGSYKWHIAIGIIIALMILCHIPISDHSSTSILHISHLLSFMATILNMV